MLYVKVPTTITPEREEVVRTSDAQNSSSEGNI